MSNLRTETESRADTPLRFTVPADFYEFPLHEDPRRRTKAYYDHLRESLPDLDEDRLLTLTLAHESTLAQLVDEGAVWAAQCFTRAENGVSTVHSATYSLLIRQANLSRAGSLDELATRLRVPGSPREVLVTDYPAGRALVVGEQVRVADPHGSEKASEEHRVRQAQIIFPLPDRRSIAILGVSTLDIDDWPPYTQILDTIARSVRLTSEQASNIAQRLNPA